MVPERGNHWVLPERGWQEAPSGRGPLTGPPGKRGRIREAPWGRDSAGSLGWHTQTDCS